LRRILVIVTALVVLGAAATAYAAINTYQATLSFTSKAPGSASKPVPIGFTQSYQATGTNGNRTAVLTKIVTKVYGLTVDSKDFPTCSLSSIATAQTDAKCPKKAEFATGAITAVLGSAGNFATAGQACDPQLDTWNSGPGKLTFFFVDTPAHECLGGALHTGQVGPYPATYSTQGKYLIVTVPVPSYVDYPLGAAGGLAGSLTSETLHWLQVTAKAHGKTVAAISAVGCLKGKRPYATTFTATLPTSGQTETVSVPGTAACS
jgi:hypothetical protein